MKVLIGSDAAPTKKFEIRFLWEPRDTWIGLFWNTVEWDNFIYRLFYVTLIPCFPLCFVWRQS